MRRRAQHADPRAPRGAPHRCRHLGTDDRAGARRGAPRALEIRYVRASYTDLGMFPDASFDAVVSFMALMDGPRFDLAMRESFRVLRPRDGSSSASPILFHHQGRQVASRRGRGQGQVDDGRVFQSRGWVERWRFTDAPPEAPEFAVPRFDRTLSEYVNGSLERASCSGRSKSRGRLRSTARPSQSARLARSRRVVPVLPRRKTDVGWWDGPRRLSGWHGKHANPRREGPAGDCVQLLRGGV